MTTMVRDFTGVDAIPQGTDFRRTITFASSMSLYNAAITPGAVLRGALTSSDYATVYCSTADGTMVLEWSDDVTLLVGFSAAGTSLLTRFSNAVWQAEGIDGSTLLVDRIAEGRAALTLESCRTST